MKEVLLTSSALILAVLAIRFLFRKTIPRRLQYALWGLVLLRLLMPFHLPAIAHNVLTAAEDGPMLSAVEETMSRPVYARPTGSAPIVDYPEARGVTPGDAFTPQIRDIRREPGNYAVVAGDGASVTFYERISVWDVLRYIWYAGMAVMALWLLAANLRFYRLLRRTRKPFAASGSKYPVYICDDIPSPCLFGIFRPSIYLTSNSTSSPRTLRYVLAHEQTHARHLDPLWSLLRAVCLAVYWFDPLVWLAAHCSKLDCELACDEGVLARLGDAERIPYGETLLALIPMRRGSDNPLLSATTMTAGKREMQDRITRIAEHHRPMLAALLAVLLLTGAVCAATFTGAKARTADTTDGPLPAAIALQPQLELLADSADIWRIEDEDDCDWWGYAVADLDQNGYLELIASRTEGSGHFTATWLYEIYDADGVLKLRELTADYLAITPNEPESGEAQTYDSYYSGRAFDHIFENVVYASGLEWYTNIHAISLEEGRVHAQVLASRTTRETFTDTESVIAHEYADGLGESIEAVHYENIGALSHPHWTPYKLSLLWVEDFYADETDAGTLLDRLTRSYDGFALTSAAPDYTAASIDAGTLELYRGTLSRILTELEERGETVLPDGQSVLYYLPASWINPLSKNRFALYDVDGDGRVELLLSYTTTAVAGYREFVFDYNPTTGVWHEQTGGCGRPGNTYYADGSLKVIAMHNQIGSETVWPYDAFRYDPGSDMYYIFGDVYSEENMRVDMPNNAFPASADADGSGVVYHVATEPNGDDMRFENAAVLDDAAYEAWYAEAFGGAWELPVLWYPLTAENIASFTLADANSGLPVVYAPGAVLFEPGAEPESWDVYERAVPLFLDEGQQDLYRRALRLYELTWGEETSAIDDSDLAAEPARTDLFAALRSEAVELDGSVYLLARSRYRSWAGFSAMVDSIFTKDFWNGRNLFGGIPVYRDYYGTLAYLDLSRGGGYYYNPNIPDEFRLESKTDDEIRFTLIGHYAPVWPKYNETYDQRDERLARGEEYYTLEFPIRMVRTEDGWRFDEFYSAAADEAEPGGWLEAHGWFEPDDTPAHLSLLKRALLGTLAFPLDTSQTRSYALDAPVTLDELTADDPSDEPGPRFTFIDLDGDGVEEAVYERGWYSGYIVLRYWEGQVYGYEFNYRGMMQLKQDGTFGESGGAGDSGCGRLRFTGADCVVEDFMRLIENVYGDSYTVEGESVSRNAYFRAVEAQNAKSDADWIEYTPQNVEMQEI